MYDTTTGREPGLAGISRRRTLQTIASTAAITGVGGLSGVAGAQSDDAGIPTPRLHVDGNVLKDPEGNVVRLRGVNIADPRRIHEFRHEDGKTAAQSVDYFVSEETGWYTRVIRLPMQPQDIAGKPSPWVAHHDDSVDPEGYVDFEDRVGYYEPGLFDEAMLESYLEDYVDPFVDRCAERGVYCILDYHRHWDGGELEFHDSDLDEEVQLFWDTVAPRYADDTQVLYELYNEPTSPGMWGDPSTTDWVADVWYEWLDAAQPWVDTIREHAPETIVILGSPSWTQSPEGALVEPFEGENLAYAYHIYPDHDVSQEQAWDDASINGEGVAEVYEEVPLFVSEWGWSGVDQDVQAEYGEPFLEWMEASDAIHWQAWNLSARWGDLETVVDGDCEDLPCEWTYDDSAGSFVEFVRTALADRKDQNLPEATDTTNDGDDPPCEAVEAADGEQLETGDWVCDVDGDGYYRDFTTSGDVTTQDLQHFFGHQHQEPWDSRTDLFDYVGNDEVGQPDVVDLFRSI